MADGSLKFDTKIDTGEFDKSIASLSKAVERFSAAVDKLSGNIANGFQGAGTAVQETGEKAAEASKGVESIGAAADEAKNHVKDLQKQMENIKVEQNPGGEPLSDAEAAKSKVVPIENPDAYGYDKSAMEFVEQYGQKTQQSAEKVNALRQGIERLKEQLKSLESQGFYFGDDEYDKTYLKLKKVEQALKDYKKELVSPTPNANPFGTDSMSGKILDLQTRMQKLAESGKGLGDAEYDELYRKLAIAKEEAKNYAAELAKTPAMIEKENQLLAEKQAKQEAAAQKEAQRQAAAKAKEDAKIAAEEKALQVKRAAEVQEALEQQRLEGIAQAAQVSSNEIIKLREELAQLNARQADLGKAGLGLGYQEYDANTQRIADINAQLSEYKKQLSEGQKHTSKFAAIVRAGFWIASQAAGKFGTAIGDATIGKAKRAIGNIRGLGKASGVASKSVLKLSNMFQMMLIRMAMRAAIQGAKEGMENLVQYSAGANKSMSELSSGAMYMKNSLAAAFEPILSFVVPPLMTIINLLATAVGWVNQFFSALGGATTFTKAKKTNEDYAKSLKKTGGAASKAGKEANKALAPFDKLNKLEEKSNSGGGGGGGPTTDPSQMFETASIEKGIGDFANKLKDMWNAGDWKGIGQLLGQKVNEMIDSVDWNAAGHKIGYGINSAIQMAYWFLDTVNFTNIGSHIAELFNGALSEIDFYYAGALLVKGMTIIPDMMIGFFTTLDWGLVGSSISDFLIGAFDEGTKFFQKYDWSELGTTLWQKFKDLVAGIDWGDISTSMFTFFGAAIRAALGFLGGFFGSVGADIKKWWDDEIKGQDWKETAANLLNALGEGFADLATWVWDNIIDPFCTALLGEDTWSDVKEVGKHIWDGFCDGVKQFFSNPGAFIKANITDPFVNKVKSLLGIHSPSTVMKEIGGYTVDGFNEGVEKKQSGTQGVVQTWASKVGEWFSEKLGISSSKDAKESQAWAESIMSGYNDTIDRNYTQSQSVMGKWADSIKTWFWGTAFSNGATNGLYQEFYNMARMINQGFANGINDFSHLAQNAVQKWGAKIVSDAKAELDIHSPSREAYSIAEYFIQGFNNGLADMVGSSVSTARKWLSGVTDVFDGVKLDLPVSVSIPNASSYLPRMALGTVVPSQAGIYSQQSRKSEKEDHTDSISLLREIKNLLSRLQNDQGGDVTVTAVLDGKVVYENVVKRNQLKKKQTGKNPLLV